MGGGVSRPGLPPPPGSPRDARAEAWPDPWTRAGVGAGHGAWRGAWYRAHLFVADPGFPRDARAWVAGAGPTEALPTWVWWAGVPAGGGFALVYHQLTGEIGCWLTEALRGQGLGGEGLRQGISRIGRDKNRLLMATVPRDNRAALRICAAAGMRPIADQPDRVVFGLYR